MGKRPAPPAVAQVVHAVPALAAAAPAAKRQRVRRDWPCPHCVVVVTHESQGNLLRHIREQHGIGVSVCTVCDEHYANPQLLMKHVQTLPHCSPVPTLDRTGAVLSSPPPTVEQIKVAWKDFYIWCSEVPTAHEQDIKRKAQRSVKSLRTLERDIQLLITLAHQLQPGVFASSGPRPAILAHDPLVRALLNHLQTQRTTRQRRTHDLVGLSASRLIELCTALKKVVGFVANRLTRDSGVFVQLNRFDAYTTVTQASNEQCVKLKQRRKNNKQNVATNILTADEMFQVARECIKRLGLHAAQHPAGSTKKKRIRYYRRHLVTALLILCMAPRSQCIQQLTELDILPTSTDTQPFVRSLFPPHSHGNATDQYVISLPAAANKHGDAWRMTVPASLTVHLDYWRRCHCTPGQRWLFTAEAYGRSRGPTVRAQGDNAFGCEPGQMPRGVS
ncbi:hypothetical protein MMC34_008402 [Xylographa carneopallida]|nr:hypothetical protein [Xylographa carneopallida]